MSALSRTVLDVTSFISAEEFVLTQNRGEAPLDPFARQCYAEVVQSLIFFDEVLVPHPTRLDPRPEDYGPQPRMLQFLFELGIVRPLTFTSTDATVLDSAERALFDTLESKGAVLLSSYIDTTTSCDREQQSAGRHADNAGKDCQLEQLSRWQSSASYIGAVTTLRSQSTSQADRLSGSSGTPRLLHYF